ncbi:Pre-mRNA cleavage complex II protein Clp1-domain containing protein [Nitzschia inconspicua]|uniref:Protein CLP1 homolog n=1 Tax=Nitzschia inconspicua TaxID=303405 RepID=A0A9K3LTN4_9STRA|nr:Pre-mRNA cleavage complex II protein Clp1-domain containing protein [Nitzschia inconspicua]
MVEVTTDDLPPPRGERHVLQPREELRFEVAFGTATSGASPNLDVISFCLQKGSCELYGCELAVQKVYSIPQGGIKVALFTWHGCVIDLWEGSTVGALDISYTSDETDSNVAFVNTHAQLEALRDDASLAIFNATDETTKKNISGPRVMVVGETECGKSTLVKTLVAYATKLGRTPLWVDLDPMDNSISVPGTLAVAPMTAAAVTVESFATTGIPPNTVHPLVVYHGSSTEIHPALFKGQIDRLAHSIQSRMDHDEQARASGIVVNTNGWIRDEGYELLLHTAEALKISVLLVLGHDRLYSMMTSHYKKLQREQGDDTSVIPKVLKLPRSGGIVSRPSDFIRQCRSRAVKKYFYGDMIADNTTSDAEKESKTAESSMKRIPQLTPFLSQLPLSDVRIYKVSSMALSSSLLPVAQQQTTDAVQIIEIDLQGSTSDVDSLQHALLAVCHPAAVTAYEESGRGRDLVTAGVAGFCAVERIVKETDQIHLLSPCAGSLPSKTLIVGDITWME